MFLVNSIVGWHPTEQLREQRSDHIPLKKLVSGYFTKSEYPYKENITIFGKSGIEFDVDFLVNPSSKDTKYLATIVRDYRCAVKVNNVHQSVRLMKDCPEIHRVLLVGNRVSPPAQSLASHYGILTLDRDELLEIFRNHKWSIDL